MSDVGAVCALILAATRNTAHLTARRCSAFCAEVDLKRGSARPYHSGACVLVVSVSV